MSEPLLEKILPLALGAAVSPVIVVGEIFCLIEPAAGLRRGVMYAAGNALVVTIWLGIGLTLGHAFPPTNNGPDWLSAFLRVAMGAVMLAIGINLLLHRSWQSKESSSPTSIHPDLRAFSIGMGLMAPNLSSLVLFFPALADITRSTASGTDQFFYIMVLLLLTLSPCLAPLLLVGIAGRKGRDLLERFNHWLKPKQWALGLVVCFATASYLMVSGIQAVH